MPETELPPLPALSDDTDRFVFVLVVDTPADANPDISAVGPAVHDALTDAGVDPETQAQYLTYAYDVSEASEGWRSGSQLI